MSSTLSRVPSYRHHKPSGQAVVTICGRDIYLGKFKSAASRAEYQRLIGEWTAHGGVLPTTSELTVNELLAAFLKHAKVYYRRPDGQPTSEVKNMLLAMKRLKLLYGRTQAAEFGPIALQAVRQRMIEDGLTRSTINHDISRIRLIFKWGVANELIPAAVLQGLQAVAGLRAGRSKAKESIPVRPVPEAFIDAILPHVSAQVAAMIELQLLTGMRSGEVTIMRGADIDMTGRVWIYSPQFHKTAWHGHSRQVYLGPKSQTVLRPFLKTDTQAYLFSPADAEAERHARRFGVISEGRKTKVYPCELRRRETQRAARQRKGRKGLSERYDSISYYRAIRYGIEAENRARLADAKTSGIPADEVALVPKWHPHQLRHNAATNLRREHGIEVARVILGHRSPAITEVYAEVDHARAVEIMAAVG